MSRFLLRLTTISFFLAATSCQAMNATTAERCVFVDLQGQQGRELIPLLDSFATSHGLESDKSHPIIPRYARKSASGKLEAELSYDIGVGPFGAQLSLFRFGDANNADLVEQFDRYVERTIAPNYKVTSCAPEQFPTVYR